MEGKHVCRDCGQEFETGPELGTHRSKEHSRRGGGGGAGERALPAKVTTTEEDLAKSLIMAGAEAGKVDGIVELYTSGNPTPTHLAEVMRGYLLKPHVIKNAVRIYFKDYGDLDLSRLFPDQLPNAGPSARSEVEDLRREVQELKEAERKREEEARRAQDKVELDKKFALLQQQIAAMAATSQAAPQSPSEVEVLRKQLEEAKEAVRSKDLENLKAHIAQQDQKIASLSSNGPGKIAAGIKEIEETARNVLGMSKGSSEIPKEAFETANAFIKVLPEVARVARGLPPLTPAQPSPRDPPHFNKAVPLGPVQDPEKLKNLEAAKAGEIAKALEEELRALEAEAKAETERLFALAKATAALELQAAQDKQRVKEAENLFGPIDTRGLPPHSPEAREGPQDAQEGPREGREGSPAVGEGLDIEALKASVSKRIASGEILVCPTGVSTFHPVDPSQWLASQELKEKATGDSGPPRSPAGEKPRPPDELPTRQAPLKKAKKARGTQT